MDSLPPKLPVIDFSKESVKPGTELWKSTRDTVVRALQEYGCFEAIYDGVSLDLHDAVFKAAKELLDLPLETKMKNTYKTTSHGYVGQESVVPLYEGLGIDYATTLEGTQVFTNLMWPSGNDFFCETTLKFSRLVAELDQTVMRMVSESYGIEDEYKELFGATSYLFRLIKYRKRLNEDETDLGLVPHTDKSFMSILHQRQVKGLEIKINNEFALIDPSPSSFIVMAGDAFMAWTNGRIESPVHRVIMRGKEERYSLGVFTFIREPIIIETPKQLLVDEPDKQDLKYKPFDHYKFIEFYYSVGLRSKCAIKDYCGY